MKFFKILVTLGFFLSMKTLAAEVSDPIHSAQDLFREGKFEEAKQQFAQIIKSDSKNFDAYFRLGNIALLSNQFAEAEKYLNKALELKPDDQSTLNLIAQLYYRQDKFDKAAPLYRKIGSDAIANQLESFKSRVPYEINSKADITRIKFVHTDPLPLIQLKVNDQQGNFIIDTGGSEIFLDPDFAKKAGASDFGSGMLTYGGGKQAATGYGRVDKVAIGDFLINNVPIHILSTQKFSAAANGLEVNGIVGTVLLYHFVSTIDYPAGELILQRESSATLKTFEEEKNKIVIPFWMSGDHLMVAWGTINNSNPLLFLIDTGLAGGGFVPSESTLKESGIQLPPGEGSEGIGGGGAVRVVTMEIPKLSLGDAHESSISGYFGPFPSKLEFSEGFRIAGIISHQFFRSYALTFDFEGMKLFLIANKNN